MRPRPSFAVLLLPALVGLAAPTAALGQAIPSPYRYIETGQEAGAFVGTMDMGTGQFDLGPGSGTLYGARYAVEISGPFSLEGVARAHSSERTVVDPRRTEGDRAIGVADALVTAVDARIKFSLPGRRTWHGIGPYVLVGGGLAFDLADSSFLEEELEARDRFDFGTSFLGVLGAGIRWVPTDRLVLRTDGALNLWQVDTPDGWREEGRGLELDSPPENEWVSGFSITLGAAIRW